MYQQMLNIMIAVGVIMAMISITTSNSQTTTATTITTTTEQQPKQELTAHNFAKEIFRAAVKESGSSLSDRNMDAMISEGQRQYQYEKSYKDEQRQRQIMNAHWAN